VIKYNIKCGDPASLTEAKAAEESEEDYTGLAAGLAGGAVTLALIITGSVIAGFIFLVLVLNGIFWPTCLSGTGMFAILNTLLAVFCCKKKKQRQKMLKELMEKR